MSEWKPYTGDYDKRWYDIRLKDGREFMDCWPNAGTFHPDGHEYIDGELVAEIRETDDPIWRKIEERHND